VCRRSVEVEDRDRQEMLPRYGLRRVACKDEFGSPGATKQPDETEQELGFLGVDVRFGS